jgi:hypothetical protein
MHTLSGSRCGRSFHRWVILVCRPVEKLYKSCKPSALVHGHPPRVLLRLIAYLPRES